ncbi:diguanylate cyclase domain-containing protein [Prochlorothrix hollandica]|uniref:diguanylate cyclase domain-containing protein n=1 Tax=Prochlorothrix hollandica TaxID=1223 RepID=UPI00034C135C|nr:diguanylate cyclase [Prochlorothrix hollandica]
MKPDQSLILVVDDITSNLKILGGILQPKGFNVTFAKNGQQALERIVSSQPDLILLDLMMPEMDGLTVCKLLKKDDRFHKIPIIFLTASHEQDHLLQAFSEGAVDYIKKPFNAPELLARVETHLELKHLQDLDAQQLAQERLIRHVVQATMESLDLKDILKAAVDGIRDYFKADRVLIYQYIYEYMDSHHRELDCSKGRIIAESLVNGYTSFLGLSLGECPWFVTDTKNPRSVHFYNTATNMETSHHKAKLLQWQVKAELVSPIFQRSEHWGSLIIHRCQSSEPWAPETVQVLSSLLEQLELAIQQAHLYQQLQLANQELRQLANVDSLTGVANRRYFDTYLAETWARLQQEQALFSLILCDIDYFKAYNDHYGHPHGDACLQQVAQAIAQATHRPTDLAARYGGEEFALLLPYTSPEGAQQVAQRLQQNIAALAIPHAQSNLDPHLTLSIGLSTLMPNPASSPEQLVSMADRALYHAKEQGRNCLKIWNA